jgi:glutathione S-transferase
MTQTIELTDTHLKYASIAEARKMPGLRLILGAYAIPGPWREACKGLFYVKGLAYTPVVTANDDASDLQMGMSDGDRELREWTAQASAPVAIWNDERPRVTYIDQINLAERLEPEPALVPSDITERALMFGLLNEIAGEHGLAWSKRLIIVDGGLKSLAPGAEGRGFFEHLAGKYGYTEPLAAAAPARMAAIMNAIDAQLASQAARGSRFLIGQQLSALDIYWATFTGLFAPLPPEKCPMGTGFRDFYSNPHAETQAALSAALLAHRDFIYEDYLELPIVF